MYKAIDLALQGGGSHGAFTWGVLERLLEVRSLVIEGVCGTSAGAMNATMLAYGMHKGGRQGAIDLLEEFWAKASQKQNNTMFHPSWLDRLIGKGRMDFSPAFLLLDWFTMTFSPYQFNPLDINPLKNLLEELVNFDELKNTKAIKLFVCATNVRTARAKVFNIEEISCQAVMASACLPHIFKAVEIDGEAYWDGGFMGNPPIFPLIDDTETEDILLVQINPIQIKKVPRTAIEIRDRLNELSFNASLMHEMRRIKFVQRILELGINDGKLRDLHIHCINPEEDLNDLGVASKLNTDWDFIQRLRKLGRQKADEWLEKNYEKLGHESTCDIRDTFL